MSIESLRRAKDVAKLVADNAAKNPDKALLVTANDSVSWRQFDRLATLVSGLLLEKRVGRFATVAIFAKQPLVFLASLVGIIRAGAAAVPLPTRARGDALRRMVAHCAPEFVISDDVRVCEELPTTAPIIWHPDTIGGLTKESEQVRTLDEIYASKAASDPFCILYSSGTTREPKGVTWERQCHVAFSAVLAEHYGLGSETSTMLATALYTPMTTVAVLLTLAIGGSFVYGDSATPGAFLDLSRRFRPSFCMLTPANLALLLSDEDRCREAMASYTRVIVGGAPLNSQLKRTMIRIFGARCSEMYGASEVGPISDHECSSDERRLGSVGRPFKDVEIRIIEADGSREMPVGAEGEVVAHSSRQMTSYHGTSGEHDPVWWADQRTGRRFVRTGDIGRVDEDGYLWLCDRKSDLIISAGFNIYSTDIEAVLADHEGVADVAVVGLSHDVLGEVPIAFVVRRLETNVAAADLRAWANQRLGRNQRVHRISFVAEIPRSSSGKVLKRELRAQPPLSAPPSS